MRLGLFMGGFTGLYSATKDCLHRWRPSAGAPAQCFAAGTVAGAAALALGQGCTAGLTLSE